MSASDPGGIVRDLAALGDTPAGFVMKGRDAELKAVLKCIGLTTRSIRPTQVWIAGPPGAGKTALALRVLDQVRQQRAAYTAYVNCWETKTLPAIVDRLLLELQIVGTQQIGARFRLDTLRRHVSGKPLLVVLDELDRLPAKERESVLYTLGDLGTVGLVCISNSRAAYFEMDQRVRSRLSPFALSLNRYSDEQVAELLLERATVALRDGAWSEPLLARVAQLANGDARVAIRSLRLAAQLAQAESADKIEEHHINAGWEHAAALHRTYLLRKRTPHHSLLYQVISEHPPANAAEVRQEYRDRCRDNGLVPVAGRTLSKYIAQLIRDGLVQQQRTTTWPNVRLLKPDARYPTTATPQGEHG